MIAPPYLIDMRVASDGKNPVHLWLPVFLLWPVVFVLGVLALVFTILVDIALMLAGQRYHHYTMLLLGAFFTFNELRGTTVRVHNPDTLLDLVIK